MSEENKYTEEEMDIVYPVISIWESKLAAAIDVKN